jgi:hypothetical protein
MFSSSQISWSIPQILTYSFLCSATKDTVRFYNIEDIKDKGKLFSQVHRYRDLSTSINVHKSIMSYIPLWMTLRTYTNSQNYFLKFTDTVNCLHQSAQSLPSHFGRALSDLTRKSTKRSQSFRPGTIFSRPPSCRSRCVLRPHRSAQYCRQKWRRLSFSIGSCLQSTW